MYRNIHWAQRALLVSRQSEKTFDTLDLQTKHQAAFVRATRDDGSSSPPPRAAGRSLINNGGQQQMLGVREGRREGVAASISGGSITARPSRHEYYKSNTRQFAVCTACTFSPAAHPERQAEAAAAAAAESEETCLPSVHPSIHPAEEQTDEVVSLSRRSRCDGAWMQMSEGQITSHLEVQPEVVSPSGWLCSSSNNSKSTSSSGRGLLIQQEVDRTA